MSNSTDSDPPKDPQGYPLYDPTFPVPKWHQDLELSAVCVFNALSFIVIVARTYMRFKKLKKFRKDDKWMVAAGLLLTFLFWPSQIAAVHFGNGLFWKNIPQEYREPQWIANTGFMLYYIISSMIKVSICCCHLLIIPAHLTTFRNFLNFRKFIYGLCSFIMSLGIVEACLWVFCCKPFAANFNYHYEPAADVSCMNLDAARYVWQGLSIIIDLIILWIPFRILKETSLQPYEKRILHLVFAANLLGTATCLIGIYGIWSDRTAPGALDAPYAQAHLVITNDLEILFYTLGASFPVLSPYLLSWSRERSTRAQSQATTRGLPSWRRKVTENSHAHQHNNGSFQQLNLTADDVKLADRSRTSSSVGGVKIVDVYHGGKYGGGERIQGWTVAMREEDIEEGNGYGKGESRFHGGSDDDDGDSRTGLRVGRAM